MGFQVQHLGKVLQWSVARPSCHTATPPPPWGGGCGGGAAEPVVHNLRPQGCALVVHFRDFRSPNIIGGVKCSNRRGALVFIAPGSDTSCGPRGFLLFSAQCLVVNDEEKLDATID
jgi:hypothetical protein